jgi:hypothetical protein
MATTSVIFTTQDHEVIKLALDIYAMAELGAPAPNTPFRSFSVKDQQPGKLYDIPAAADAVEPIKKLLYEAVQQRLEPWLKVDSLQKGATTAGKGTGSGEEACGFVRLSAIIQCINTTIADMDVEAGLQVRPLLQALQPFMHTTVCTQMHATQCNTKE